MGGGFRDWLRLMPLHYTSAVLAKQGDWLEIEPPAGAFSLISDKFVTVAANGTTGTITGNRVRVRAGTDQRTFADLAGHYIVQTHLNTGDTVEITGNGLDYYEIAPPAGVTYYIAARLVTLSDDAAESLPTTAGPIGSEADASDTTETPRATTDDDAITQFRLAEESLAEEIVKPNIQRDLTPLLAMYQNIDAPEGSAIALAKSKRIRFLEKALAIQADQKAIEQMDLSQHERRVEQESTTDDSETVRHFDAQGILRASDLFVGGAVPKRYLLRHPDTRQIIAYVEAGRQLNLGDYEGKIVGVFGDSAYNSDLGMSVITVRHLVLIDDEDVVVVEQVVATDPDVEVIEVIEEPVDVTPVETPMPDDVEYGEPESIDLDELFLDGEMPDGAPLPPESELPEDAPETIREWSTEPEDDMAEIVPAVREDDDTDIIELPETDDRDTRLLDTEEDVPDDSGPARPDHVEFGIRDEVETPDVETPDTPVPPVVIDEVEVEEVEVEEETPRTQMRDALPQDPDLPVIEDDDWSEYD